MTHPLSARLPFALAVALLAPVALSASAPGVPLFVSGTTVAITATTRPDASFSQPVHSIT